MSEEAAVRIRDLKESDLLEADRVLRLAFGRFLGADPEELFAGRNLVSTRWRADPKAAFAAELDGRLIGTNFVNHWGSFGFLGPITVLPQYWDRKVAQRLLEPAMALFDTWGVAHRGLFTFPHSPKHIHLYEKYGFKAGHLTPIVRKAVSHRRESNFETLSSLSGKDMEAAVESCRSLTDQISVGLDLTREIRSVVSEGLGEVCLIREGPTLAAFAVCHCGPSTEAGDGVCYVKFGAITPSRSSSTHFVRLLEACEAMAASLGLEYVSLGMNMGRRKAYELTRRAGYRTEFIGVAMETHPENSYNLPDVYVIDDWR